MRDVNKLCGKEYKGNSIDEQVAEKAEELNRMYKRFQRIEGCDCPLCKAMAVKKRGLKEKDSDGT